MKRILTTIAGIALLAGVASAINPGNDVWTPAAARGAGANGSFWVTDLFIFNPNQLSVDVEVYWLARGEDNSSSVPLSYSIAPEATLVLEDVILNDFGRNAGNGGFLVRSTSSLQVATDARIYNLAGTGAETKTFGQGFEGVSTSAALVAGAPAASTSHAVGGKFGSGFRTNFYGVNTSSSATKVRVIQMNLDGNSLATADFILPPWAPILKNVNELGGPQAENLTLSFEVIEGSGIFGLSTIDESTGDPTTHNMWWDLGSSGSQNGTHIGTLSRQADLAHAIVFDVFNGQIEAFYGEGIFVSEPGLSDCVFLLEYSPGDSFAIEADGSFEIRFEQPYVDTLGNDLGEIGEVVVLGSLSGESITGTIAFNDLRIPRANSSDICSGSTAATSFVTAWTSSSFCASMPSACAR